MSVYIPKDMLLSQCHTETVVAFLGYVDHV